MNLKLMKMMKMLNKQICYKCKGKGYIELWEGHAYTCKNCKGQGYLIKE